MEPLRIDGQMLSDVLPGHPDPVGATGPAGDMPTPRLAELLGVKEDEEWGIKGHKSKFRVHDGNRQCWSPHNHCWYLCDNEPELVALIDKPELIVRLPRLTEPEIAIMLAVGAMWVSRDDDPETIDYVALWRVKPVKVEDTYCCSSVNVLASVTIELFPSVKEGDCIGLDEIQ